MNRKIPVLCIVFIFLALYGCAGKISDAPILVLARQNNFGTYTGEILKAEGFNEFILDSIGTDINKSFLSRFDIVILSEKVDAHIWNILKGYVKDGGNLIAIDPGLPPGDLFGIDESSSDIIGGYISVDSSAIEGKSLAGKRIQLHENALRYTLKGAGAVAWFCSKNVTDDKFPAVVINSYGKGSTAAFLYNLPRNIVLTRQGNPEFAGIEKDSIPGLRAMDMFTDGWVDTTGNTINQADVQMELLSNCIERMSSFIKPLPRLWYFPDTLKCLVTLNNDGEFREENDFEPQFRDVDSMGAKMTLYVLKTDKVSKKWTDRWTTAGFEISGHPDDTREAGAPKWQNMQQALTDKMNEVKSLYGIQMVTVANHWFVWCGNDSLGKPEFAAQAEIEASHGLYLDANYAHYDNKSCQGHFLGSPGQYQGNFTGSGLPMRFSCSDGRILNTFQQLNNVYDQQYNENHDPEGYYSCFKGLMDRSLNDEVYSFISIKSHNDEYYFSKVPLMKMLAYAGSKGIPVWTAARLLEFIKMRDEAAFTDIRMSGSRLLFNLKSLQDHHDGLTILVPSELREKRIRGITTDGKDLKFKIIINKGFEYAMATVQHGGNSSVEVSYGE
jgi:hypothetical protein